VHLLVLLREVKYIIQICRKSSRLTPSIFWPLQMRPILSPETSLTNTKPRRAKTSTFNISLHKRSGIDRNLVLLTTVIFDDVCFQ